MHGVYVLGMLRNITVGNYSFVCSTVSALLGVAHSTGRDFGWDVLGSMFGPAMRTHGRNKCPGFPCATSSDKFCN